MSAAAPDCCTPPRRRRSGSSYAGPAGGFRPRRRTKATTKAGEIEVTHVGGCHCGAVKFKVEAPSHIVAWDCNCSNCSMRRNTHFVVKKPKLRLLRGKAALTSYRCVGPGSGVVRDVVGDTTREAHPSCAWLGSTGRRYGTEVAEHLFCKVCGITPFYSPRSNPNGWAVTVHCIRKGTISEVEVKRFDGVHWEEYIANSGIQELTGVKQD